MIEITNSIVLLTKKRARKPNTGIIIISKNDQSTIMFPKIWDFESLHFPPIATKARMIATIMKGKYTKVELEAVSAVESHFPVVVFPRKPVGQI